MESLILQKLDKMNDKLNDKLNSIERELGENSAQHEAIVRRLDEVHSQALKTNGRVNALESKWAKVTGIAIGASGLC